MVFLHKYPSLRWVTINFIYHKNLAAEYLPTCFLTIRLKFWNFKRAIFWHYFDSIVIKFNRKPLESPKQAPYKTILRLYFSKNFFEILGGKLLFPQIFPTSFHPEQLTCIISIFDFSNGAMRFKVVIHHLNIFSWILPKKFVSCLFVSWIGAIKLSKI